MHISNKRHSIAELQNDAWRTRPRVASYGDSIQSSLFFLSTDRWIRSLVRPFVAGANIFTDQSTDGWKERGWMIFGNGGPWRNREWFSQGTEKVFCTLLRGLIWITLVDCYIDRVVEVPLSTFFLSDIRDKGWHRSHRFWVTVAARSPFWCLVLLRFFLLRILRHRAMVSLRFPFASRPKCRIRT